MIIPKDTEKAFYKIRHPFIIKTLQKTGIEWTYFNIIKAIYNKPKANITLNGKKTESISSKIRNKTRVPTLITTIQLVLEFIAIAIREEKESRLEKK